MVLCRLNLPMEVRVIHRHLDEVEVMEVLEATNMVFHVVLNTEVLSTTILNVLD